MRRLQKLCAGALCLCLMAAVLAGCGPEEPEAEQTEALSVYATFYPLYAIASMLVEEVPDLRLNCLVQPQDGCLRGYALSDWDYALLDRGADLVIAGGRGLESFESLLYAMGESGPAVIKALYDLELVKQPGANTQEDSESHWLDENPHVYMSPDGALEIARRIAASLAALNPAHEALYMKNLEAAEARLTALQAELHGETAEAEGEKAAVFNEALIYLAQDWGLDVVLRYDRESGASLEGAELETCLAMLRDSGARLVLIEKQAPAKLVDALKGAGFAVASMDTLSTRRADEGAEGYFDALRENARALKAALTAEAAPAGGA